MFSMLMRKHLVGARITGISQPDNERMLMIDLDCFDELGVRSVKKLVCELIGRSANLILVGEDGRIIDCLRRVDFAGDALRRLLPGMIYKLPPKQEKIDFLSCTTEALAEKFSGLNDGQLRKSIFSCFGGSL